MTVRTLVFHPNPPYDFRTTTENQPYFRMGQGSGQNAYRRLLDLGEKLVLATAVFRGDVNNPEIRVELEGTELSVADVQLARGQLERLLGVNQDLAPFYEFAKTDPVMAHFVDSFYGMHQTLALSVFETLAQAILGQQLSASVARVIRALLTETLGPKLFVNGEIHYAFPRPQAIASMTVEELRALKLSQRKAEYLHGLALAELETPKGLDRVHSMPDEDVIREITAIRGVGMWSAQWVLLRGLGRPDAFPVGDLALKRIVSQLYIEGESLTDSQLEAFSRRWSPFRSLATSYLFAALRTGRSQPFLPAC